MTHETMFQGEYAAIPDRMREPMVRYVQDGVLPGDFLRAVISNDLNNAVARADAENLSMLKLYVQWFYNVPPADCGGSRERMLAWNAQGGLAGA